MIALLSFEASAEQMGTGITRRISGEYQAYLEGLLPLSEQRNADHYFKLGNRYLHGEGVPPDYVEAAKWFTKAAEQGHASAQYNLGLMYMSGAGVSQDDIEAVKWYRKAAEQTHAPAQYNLGVMYMNGAGVLQNYVEAV